MSTTMMSQRRVLSLGLLVAAISAAGCGGQSRDARPIASPAGPRARRVVRPCEAGLGRFAGYLVFTDPATSVDASFTVPTIATGSQPGRAGTWIGAQATGPQSSAPFIQIGVNEQREAGLGSGSDDYDAFWSDTAHHFHPVQLFTVRPGDIVSASMGLGDGQWTLTLHDASSGTTRRVVTGQEAAANFNEAEYLQEDITNTRTGRPFSYPVLSPARFTGLTFDQQPISAAEVDSQWMSLPGGDSVGPSRLAGSAFTVGLQMLSTPACRYLDLVAPLNRAWAKLSAERGTSPMPQLRAAATSFSRELRAVDVSLAPPSWPASARSPIRNLIVASSRVQRLLPEFPRSVKERSRAWEAAFQQAESADAAAARLVRRALSAPAP